MKFCVVLLFKEHLHDLEDNRQFAVFCVARIGSQIYDTSLVNPVDRHSTDVTFSDVLLFSKVSEQTTFSGSVWFDSFPIQLS